MIRDIYRQKPPADDLPAGWSRLPAGRLAKARSDRLYSCKLRRTKEDYSRKRAGLTGCTGPKINKVEGSSSLPKLPNQNELPVTGMAFQERMPGFQSRLENREYLPSVCNYFIL